MEKEKMMLEDDPEKTRKWEVRPQRAPTERERERKFKSPDLICPLADLKQIVLTPGPI